MTGEPALFDVVVPTIGRPSLAALLASLDRAGPPRPGRVVVVDDRRPADPLVLPAVGGVTPRVVRSGGRGPAAARNTGWRRCAAPWVVFLDDDVTVTKGWSAQLASDLRNATSAVGASQGRIVVPRDRGARLTDAERNVAALSRAAYITADMAVRRTALVALDGFDERFPRAYREDTELALRLLDGGWHIAMGTRRTLHPLRPGTWRTSVRAQRGNADDALMTRLHGPGWRDRGHAPRGGLAEHRQTTAWMAAALALRGARRTALAAAAGGVAAARVGRLWWSRVQPGPADAAEWLRMAASSALLPPAATWWAAAGWLRARRLAPNGTGDIRRARVPALVLFDRDGTLVHDVPYNGDPEAVEPVAGARQALDRLRAAGVQVGLVTNQSGVGRGLLTMADVAAVNRRVAELLGPFATVQVCPHAPEDGCPCRKPQPGLVEAAAAELGITLDSCAVIGDIGADVEAALAAGARAILVPNAATLVTEIATAPECASDLGAAVDVLLDPSRGRAPSRSDSFRMPEVVA